MLRCGRLPLLRSMAAHLVPSRRLLSSGGGKDLGPEDFANVGRGKGIGPEEGMTDRNMHLDMDRMTSIGSKKVKVGGEGGEEEPRADLKLPPRTDLQLFRSMWGVEGIDKPEKRQKIFERLKRDGYTGVETGPFIVGTGGVPKWVPDPADAPHREAFRAALEKNDLQLIAMLHSCGYPVDGQKTAADHLASIREQAVVAKEMGAVLLNVHGGRDAWDTETALPLLRGVAELEAEIGIPMCFETHRQRLFWNPWQTRDLIKACNKEKIPLKLNADLSHWCAAGERVFNPILDPEFEEILELVIDRVHLVHGRVGWAQGAQVPDPRVSEYADELDVQERWWDVMLLGMLQRGIPARFEPEFGPAPYMINDPSTGIPLADVSEVNDFIAERMVNKWAEYFGEV